MKKILKIWDSFWFRHESTESLSLLRIVFGFVLLLKLTGVHGLYRLGDITARFPKHYFNTERNFLFDGFNLAVPGFDWLPTLSLVQYQFLETAIFIFAILFVVGLSTRFVGPILALSYGYLFVITQFTYSHHIYLLVLVLLILGFSRSGDHYSLDAYIRGKHNRAPDRSIMPTRLIQVLVTSVYFFGLVAKLNAGWFDGMILADNLTLPLDKCVI